MFTTINNNKYKHICIVDIVYVKKRQRRLWHIIEMLSMAIKDFVAA